MAQLQQESGTSAPVGLRVADWLPRFTRRPYKKHIPANAEKLSGDRQKPI